MSIIKKFRITKFKKQKPLISLENISLSFKKNFLILDNISLTISKGEIIGLLGPNGAGKSSLMNIITGLIKPNYGSIIINNEDIYSLNFTAVISGALTKARTSEKTADILNSSNLIDVSITYDNGGNPSANAYLDYIEIIGEKSENCSFLH